MPSYFEDELREELPEEMDFEYATAMAGRARELMVRHAVAPTADNFSVWFQYALGTEVEFNRTIDALVESEASFDSKTNAELARTVRKLNGRERLQSQIVTDRLQNALDKATSYLARAAAEHHSHIAKLGEVGSQVSSGADVIAIIGQLTSELTRAAMRATALEVQFAATSKELEQVRSLLKVAEKFSRTDPLTGLANRRAFDEQLGISRDRSMDRGESLCLMLIDLDNFKSFNDSFGHQVGDHVLRLLAGVLISGLRQTDFAARYGGEEFVALLSNADLTSCKNIAERVRTSIARRQIVRRSTGEVLAKVTVSIGIAQFVPDETAESFVSRCDRALYEAKRIGRNCTASAEGPDGELTVEPTVAVL